MSIIHARKKSKPIDRWLSLGGVAVGVLLFLIEKTPVSVIVFCAVLFALLIHPLWNFWWIEDSSARRRSATAVFIIALIFLAWNTWPEDKLAKQLCPHALRFTVSERDDDAVNIITKRAWFKKPASAITLFSRSMAQMAQVNKPANVMNMAAGWNGGSAFVEFTSPMPSVEWEIVIPKNPELICVNQDR